MPTCAFLLKWPSYERSFATTKILSFVKSLVVTLLNKFVSRSGVFNPRPAGRLQPSGEFCAAREGYFTKYNELWILKLESLDTLLWLKENKFSVRSKILNNYPKLYLLLNLVTCCNKLVHHRLFFHPLCMGGSPGEVRGCLWRRGSNGTVVE